MAKKTKAATPALEALAKAGVPHRVREYEFENAGGSIGLAAAEALGVEPSKLLKTLVVKLEGGEAVCALIPSDAELDLKALAAAAGAKRAAMASVPEAEKLTGYVKGGISPFGQRKRLRAFVDRSALEHATVLVNGGRRGLQAELTPDDMCRGLGAAVAPLAKA